MPVGGATLLWVRPPRCRRGRNIYAAFSSPSGMADGSVSCGSCGRTCVRVADESEERKGKLSGEQGRPLKLAEGIAALGPGKVENSGFSHIMEER